MNPSPLLIQTVVRAALAAVLVSTTLAQAASDKTSVSGTFLGNGKDGRIQHLVVTTREPFSDKGAIRLVFSEKDPSKSKNLDMDVTFNRLGSALMLSVFKDGTIFGCVVSHSAHEKSGFSALGEIKIEDFKVSETEVSGRVTTGGELDAFGEKWAVDLKFSAPLPAGAFALAAAESPPGDKPMPAPKQSVNKVEAPPAAKGSQPTVAQLPLPEGVRDVEYKSIVQQIAFSATESVSTVSKDLAAKLDAQGWKAAPGSLMGQANAILKRKLNEAELTIMVQPAAQGCTVKIFTQGVDWSETPASAPATAPAKSDAAAVEAEANRLLNNALKGFPGLK